MIPCDTNEGLSRSKSPSLPSKLLASTSSFEIDSRRTNLVGKRHGFGHHGGNPTFFLRVLWAGNILYNTGIALTKLSVLAFYRRIFSKTRSLRITITIVGTLTICCWVVFNITAILSCVPIQGYWNPRIKARCEQRYPFFLGVAISNIVLDLVLLLLPLRSLWNL